MSHHYFLKQPEVTYTNTGTLYIKEYTNILMVEIYWRHVLNMI